MKKLWKTVILVVILAMPMCLTSFGAQDDKGIDAVIVIDTSGSMKETDPSRISIDAAKLFIDMMESSGSQVGVVPFSDELGEVTDLTFMNSVSDKNVVKNRISTIMYDGDTDIGAAALEGFRLLDEAQDTGNQKMMLLFTDVQIDLPGVDEEQREKDSLDNTKAAVLNAKNAGISIYTIGLNANGKVDQDFLEDMAVQTGGRSYMVSSAGALPRIFNEIFADFVNSNIVSLGEYETNGTDFTEIPVDIPNDSVLEANIIMLSTDYLTEVEMMDPDGKVLTADGSKLILSRSDQYSMLKMVMPESGIWNLRIKSGEGCRVHINLIFNYKVSLVGSAQFAKGEGIPKTITVKGHLEKDGTVLEDESLYQQFVGNVIVTDENNEQQTYPLSVNGCSFEGSVPVEGVGTYKLVLKIDSNTMYRESEEIEVEVSQTLPEKKPCSSSYKRASRQY